MRPRSSLFNHQKAMAARIREGEKVAILQEPGYGKTAAVLTGLQDSRQLPALVVAPARVARDVWHREAMLWKHLQGLRVNPIIGTPDQRIIRLGHKADVEVISYENLVWLSNTLDLNARYKAVVWDEVSKMKAPGTARFRRMRHRAMGISTRIGLTGTPIGNHLLDLWGEMFMVAGPEPLGPTFVDYRGHYFAPEDFYQRKWALKHPAMREAIFNRVKPWTYRLPPTPDVKIPPLRVNEVPVAMPEKVQAQAEELTRELIVALDSGTDLQALSASTLAMKLRQFASGAVYTKGEKWDPLHPEKVDAALDIVDELQGEPCLVFYWFKHERERLLARFKGAGKVVATADDKDAFDRWNNREIEVLLVHPQSAGHGLNLQHGGHNLIWFALPWSHELWVQGNGRLARTGQTARQVNAHVLLCGDADWRVLAALERKGETEQALLDYLLA